MALHVGFVYFMFRTAFSLREIQEERRRQKRIVRLQEKLPGFRGTSLAQQLRETSEGPPSADESSERAEIRHATQWSSVSPATIDTGGSTTPLQPDHLPPAAAVASDNEDSADSDTDGYISSETEERLEERRTGFRRSDPRHPEFWRQKLKVSRRRQHCMNGLECDRRFIAHEIMHGAADKTMDDFKSRMWGWGFGTVLVCVLQRRARCMECLGAAECLDTSRAYDIILSAFL